MTVPDLWRLPWTELDPALREFDAGRIPALVRALGPAGEMMTARTHQWYDRMTVALLDELGPWAVGWARTVEIRDRRAIWRFAPPPVTTPERTLTAVADAVVAWHELLIEIATDARGRFAVLPVVKGKHSGDGPPAWKALKRPTASPAQPPPYYPTWADFDPTGRPFDAGSLPAVAYNVLLRDGPDGVTAGLMKQYGQWASGWHFTPGAAPTVDGITIGRPVHRRVAALSGRDGLGGGGVRALRDDPPVNGAERSAVPDRREP